MQEAKYSKQSTENKFVKLNVKSRYLILLLLLLLFLFIFFLFFFFVDVDSVLNWFIESDS